MTSVVRRYRKASPRNTKKLHITPLEIRTENEARNNLFTVSIAVTGTDVVAQDIIHSIIQQAVLAPSSHNTQPWRFRVARDCIDLLADRTRALPVNDPFDRELVISCGAALLTLRAAAAAAGLGTHVTVLPNAADADWLARVNLTADPADTALAYLAPFIERRRTYRRAFDGHSVAPEAMVAVAKAVEMEGAQLHTLVGEQRTQAGQLVAEGDLAQWNDPHWRRELALWMHPSRDGDGLTVPLLTTPIAQAVVRRFDMGKGVAAKDEELLLGSPWLTVLTTTADDPLSWLKAGQALQRALLVACQQGLQASYLNQPVEVTPLRVRLQHLLGTDQHPQLLMRWGYPTQNVPPAVRRPVDSVLEAPVN